MFPIVNRTGNVVGFTGRYIGKKSDIPKYLNTSETELYSKKNTLFGLHLALREIKNNSTVVLVEGNPDAVRLQEIGVGNVVAPMGTALTAEQIHILRQYAKSVIMIGDTDKAGIEAVIKNGKTLLEAGFNVRLMILPEGKDPDEYFRVKPREYEDCLNRQTYDYIPWICKRLMGDKRSQTEIASTITEVSELMSLCEDQRDSGR